MEELCIIFVFDVKVEVDCTACTAPDLKVEDEASSLIPRRSSAFGGEDKILIQRRANTLLTTCFECSPRILCSTLIEQHEAEV